MNFGENLQFLRKMHQTMTQEELAEKMGVSRQTISKWESDAAFPEMEKALALCALFSCSLDELMRGKMDSNSTAYHDLRVEQVPAFRYVAYAAISREPEEDAIHHVTAWSEALGLANPTIIGWDFPFVSQEQINVYHMHGYAAACILPEGITPDPRMEVTAQPDQSYAVITIEEPFMDAFNRIPNAYKTLMRYMEVNGLKHKQAKEILPCFEKQYEKEGIPYMDVYIAV